MLATVEPIRPFECTFKDCFMSFETEKAMLRHKKHSDEHDYCHKCNEDFDSYEDYTMHKIYHPDKHDKACRICGDEFKVEAALKIHIELNHKINQALTCIGCAKSFYSATLFMEHLEFGHCEVISPQQFHGHIVHKHLITELLKNEEAMARFREKTAKFDAAQDYEEEGGILLEDPLDNEEGVGEVDFKALQLDSIAETPAQAIAFPPLPSQTSSTNDAGSLVRSLDNLSVAGESTASTVIASPVSDRSPGSDAGSRVGASEVSVSSKTIGGRDKGWVVRKDNKAAISTLFSNAKPTPASKQFSIQAYDSNMQDSRGLNILRDRFWDPLATEFNAENYFNTIDSKYYCPFVCDQNFLAAADLKDHIIGEHRITRMKCPTCLKYYKSATALMAHCESRGAKCSISKAEDFNIFLDRISGGFLGVEEQTRPDHLNNPTIMRTHPETGRMEKYSPPVATYLQYVVTMPPDWKEPLKTLQIGDPQGAVFH